MNNDKLLLLKALNNNVSTFSHLANEAKELSDGVIRICFDSISKCAIFKCNHGPEDEISILRINFYPR